MLEQRATVFAYINSVLSDLGKFAESRELERLKVMIEEAQATGRDEVQAQHEISNYDAVMANIYPYFEVKIE